MNGALHGGESFCHVCEATRRNSLASIECLTFVTVLYITQVGTYAHDAPNDGVEEGSSPSRKAQGSSRAARGPRARAAEEKKRQAVTGRGVC
jgi:hypothetical protein